MSQTFEQRSGGEHYRPEHNGIDFQERRIKMLGFTSVDQLTELWWHIDEEGTEQQLTSANLVVHMSNLSDDPMDRIMAYNERDGQWIVWWRQEHENFNDILQRAMTFGKTIMTPDPEPDVVKMFIEMHSVDLDSLEKAVDDWSQEDDSGDLQ